MDWIDHENPGRYQYIYNCPACGVTVRCPRHWKGLDKYRQVYHCPDCGKEARERTYRGREPFTPDMVAHLIK